VGVAGGRGQAQSPGSEDRRGVDRGGIGGGNTEGTQTSEEVRGVAGVGDGESAGIVDTTSKLALYQDCNTLVTRIEIRIMRLRKDKGVRIKGALQATQDPNAERT
jgi:hypothetical protein